MIQLCSDPAWHFLEFTLKHTLPELSAPTLSGFGFHFVVPFSGPLLSVTVCLHQEEDFLVSSVLLAFGFFSSFNVCFLIRELIHLYSRFIVDRNAFPLVILLIIFCLFCVFLFPFFLSYFCDLVTFCRSNIWFSFLSVSCVYFFLLNFIHWYNFRMVFIISSF